MRAVRRRPAGAGPLAPARAADGQAAVELALALPVVVLLLLAVVQAGLVVTDQVAVTQAAREAVRRAAVGGDAAGPPPARLDPARLSVSSRRSGDDPPLVTVVVRYRSPTDVPLVGPLLPDVELGSEATMAAER